MVRHPVRRRIIMSLMLLGNAGIASVVATLLITFYSTGQSSIGWYYRVLILGFGILFLWRISSSRFFDRWFGRLITRALNRWTDLNIRDYASLLHLAGEYQINEMIVEQTDWLANRSLAELALPEEGIIVLGIQRGDSAYFGAPDGNTVIRPADVLILYGPESAIHNLDDRHRGQNGDLAHRKAVGDFRKVRQEELSL